MSEYCQYLTSIRQHVVCVTKRCDYCLAYIFVRYQNIVNMSHLFDDMLLMS